MEVEKLAKDPAKVRAGYIGAQKRWGERPRSILRLDRLSAEKRAIVLALLELGDPPRRQQVVDDAA